MNLPSKEKRQNLLVVRFTESEMEKIREFKKSNRKINISQLVRNHLLELINQCTNVHKQEDMSKYGDPKDWTWKNPEQPKRA